jgi:hypothetical protein
LDCYRIITAERTAIKADGVEYGLNAPFHCGGLSLNYPQLTVRL